MTTNNNRIQTLNITEMDAVGGGLKPLIVIGVVKLYGAMFGAGYAVGRAEKADARN